MPTVCEHGVLDGRFNCPQCVGDGELREAHETIVELEARIEELGTELARVTRRFNEYRTKSVSARPKGG